MDLEKKFKPGDKVICVRDNLTIFFREFAIIGRVLSIKNVNTYNSVIEALDIETNARVYILENEIVHYSPLMEALV